MINLKGEYYNRLIEQNSYNERDKECIENTVKNIMSNDTSVDKPGMMLGKIQSGKTRAFTGVIGLAFDNDYDVAIILTKGTKALVQQTYERLKKEFYYFYQEEEFDIFDIMKLPDDLVQYELDCKKIVIVVKKEKNNLARLHDALFHKYKILGNKRILIIDDEADYASIGFNKTKKEGIEIRTLAGQIDDIRKKLRSASFLQVTATPYSLYLQPQNIEIKEKNQKFLPVKPAFTTLVPYGSNYVGGEIYFKDSLDNDNIAHYLFDEVKYTELDVLKQLDRRKFKIEEALRHNRISTLRNAVVNFLVGGSIRRLQLKEEGKKIKKQKYSLIVHTEQKKESHSWQYKVVSELLKQLSYEAENNTKLYKDLIKGSYNSLKESVELAGFDIPQCGDVIEEVSNTLHTNIVRITKVNSEKDVATLLDDSGQLRLRTPFNIFIGGQILDRGITIGNLIGFYYGRNPKKFQQDTVLQHSRMYGYRPKEDLAVTRFYTTGKIFNVMKKINDFDETLRDKIKSSDDKGVIFIHKDEKNEIAPCSPNKILLSDIMTIKPYKRILPVGFNTLKYKKDMRPLMDELDNKISRLDNGSDYFKMDYEDAVNIINLISKTLEFEHGYEFDFDSMSATLRYLCENNYSSRNKVYGIIRRERNIRRFLENTNRYSDAPDSAKGIKSEGKLARVIGKDNPVLILLRQNGKEELGWNGHPFWWPVLVAPKKSPVIIYTANEAKEA